MKEQPLTPGIKSMLESGKSAREHAVAMGCPSAIATLCVDAFSSPMVLEESPTREIAKSLGLEIEERPAWERVSNKIRSVMSALETHEKTVVELPSLDDLSARVAPLLLRDIADWTLSETKKRKSDDMDRRNERLRHIAGTAARVLDEIRYFEISEPTVLDVAIVSSCVACGVLDPGNRGLPKTDFHNMDTAAEFLRWSELVNMLSARPHAAHASLAAFSFLLMQKKFMFSGGVEMRDEADALDASLTRSREGEVEMSDALTVTSVFGAALIRGKTILEHLCPVIASAGKAQGACDSPWWKRVFLMSGGTPENATFWFGDFLEPRDIDENILRELLEETMENSSEHANASSMETFLEKLCDRGMIPFEMLESGVLMADMLSGKFDWTTAGAYVLRFSERKANERNPFGVIDVASPMSAPGAERAMTDLGKSFFGRCVLKCLRIDLERTLGKDAEMYDGFLGGL